MEVTAVIEIERHSNQKFEYNRHTNKISLDRVLPYPYFYPFAYGYFPNTLSMDGDELDLLLLTDRTYTTNDCVKCRIVGGLMMEDEKGMDEKIFVVPVDDPWYDSLSEDKRKETHEDILWFFSNYKSKETNKWSRVHGLMSLTEAEETYKKFVLTSSASSSSSSVNSSQLTSENLTKHLEWVKRVSVPAQSIFYSVVEHTLPNGSPGLWGVCRNYYSDRNLTQVLLDSSFNIVKSNGIQYRGEDPRLFMHKDRLYIVDNYFNDVFVIDAESKEYVKVNAPGKNFSFFSFEGEVFLIHYMKPFVLLRFDMKTGNVMNVAVNHECQKEVNLEYRGGTPGYACPLRRGVYVGYGHRTYYSRTGALTHDIFRWEVNMLAKDGPSIVIEEVQKPKGAMNICDPTCAVSINGNCYLFTAESMGQWNREQEYVTNVYKLTKK